MNEYAAWLERNERYTTLLLQSLQRRLAGTVGDPASLETQLALLEATQPVPALRQLQARLNLTDFERQTLFLCAAPELDPGIASTFAAMAATDASRGHPSFALAHALFEDPSWDAMSPERPLRNWRLVEIVAQPGQPLLTSPLRTDERIVSYLRGVNHIDERLAPLLTAVAARLDPLPPSQEQIATEAIDCLERAAVSRGASLLQFIGGDAHSKLGVARRVCARLGAGLYRALGSSLPLHGPELEAFVRLWQRECALLPLALYIDVNVERPSSLQPLLSKLTSRGVIVFADTHTRSLEAGEGVCIEVAKPQPLEQRDAWIDSLGEEDAAMAERLAAQFNFNLDVIEELGLTAAQARTGGSEDPNGALWKACLHRARPALDQLAHPIDVKATWSDLELPAAEKGLLQQIAHQARNRLRVYDDWGFRERMNRGLGISALFAGDSGTGKTMAAEVIANELSLLLYRIDLSAVVSKYIGDTERNLRALFDAAEDGGAVLFFDEADALFGKRSEVRDSHDRYANIEVDYLLQRIESYRGLAILATNMRAALDGAFVRRLRFIVNFPFPAVAERAAIWRKAFPARTPLAALDFDQLARLNLSGGSIHSIALSAAFLAAHDGAPVSMSIVLDAARAELRKLEKPIIESTLRRMESAGARA